MAMSLPILLILIGIVLALLVHYGLGIACIVIGLVLLIWPRITAGSAGKSLTVAGRAPRLGTPARFAFSSLASGRIALERWQSG